MGKALGLVGIFPGVVRGIGVGDLERLGQSASNGGIHAGSGRLLDWKTPDFQADVLSYCRFHADL